MSHQANLLKQEIRESLLPKISQQLENMLVKQLDKNNSSSIIHETSINIIEQITELVQDIVEQNHKKASSRKVGW